MKKSIKYTRLFIMFLFVECVFSCKKDFLDVPDRSTLIRQEYVTDLATLGDYMNGIYILFSSEYNYGYNIIYADLIADDVKPVAGSGIFLSQYSWAQLADEVKDTKPSENPRNMNPLWTVGYKIIRSCNFVLEEVDNYRNENPSGADNIKGQALALRAMVFHQMLNVFSQPYGFSSDASHSGIPYVTTSDWTKPVTRQTVADVYNGIVNDLNQAISLLPATIASRSLMNRNAAKALLARAYLFMGNFRAAKQFAREVATTVPIMTVNYPQKLFTDDDTEALFRLPPSLSNYITYAPSLYYRLIGQFLATRDIDEVISEIPGDLRKSWITDEGGSLKVTKFPEGAVSGIPIPAVAYYVTLIRSSEMYLTAAEAYAELGEEDSARFFVNAIRLRADATAPAYNVTGQALIDSIYKERRKELCFEGFRIYDLLRTGKGVYRMDAPHPNSRELPYPSSKAIAPIPMLDTKLSGLQQNPGY